MKKIILLFAIVFLFVGNSLIAQTIITFENPSFEGTPAPHVTPPLWNACLVGNTPDTQPGSWGISLAPSNGSSYIGLVHLPSTGWQEGVSQQLSSPINQGTPYKFYVDLATTNTNQGGIAPGPIELQVWGGDGTETFCNHSELLWSSGNITNLVWNNFAVNFTPSANHTYLLLLSHNLDVDTTSVHCVLVDNLSAVAAVEEYNPDALSFSVYPNPISDVINIQVQQNSPISVSMKLMNVLGEVVLEKTISGNLNTFNTEGISNGIYFLELRNKSYVYSKKLIINK